jgi:hypothetical protein
MMPLCVGKDDSYLSKKTSGSYYSEWRDRERQEQHGRWKLVYATTRPGSGSAGDVSTRPYN